ncbi:exported hypothetical protein [Cupriavidus taiwanensis]|nr:exported hypothetical protein [Cupriavidus taiwanensis]
MQRKSPPMHRLTARPSARYSPSTCPSRVHVKICRRDWEAGALACLALLYSTVTVPAHAGTLPLSDIKASPGIIGHTYKD